MPRVLITVLPLVGHLNPALAIADGLRQQGHEIAWAVHHHRLAGQLPPQDRIYSLDRTDFPLPEVGEQATGLESVRIFFEDYAIPLAQWALAPLESAVDHFRPDVMLVDHQMAAGALVARKLGLPWVSLVSTTASIIRLSAQLDDWVAAQLLSLQQAYLPAGQITERPDFSPYCVLVCSIRSLINPAHVIADSPYAFVGPVSGEGRKPVEFPWDWLQAGRPCLLITAGTVSRDRDTRFFDMAMAAMAELPQVQAIMIAPTILAAQAPDNVLVRDKIPQLEVLDHAQAVICHAGHNTVCEALIRNLPLAVAPIRDDQPLIARQVVDAGAALYLRYGKVTPATLRSAIERLLSDESLAGNARRLGEELRAAPGTRGAVDAITRVMGGQAWT